MPHYLLNVDDSGNREYAAPGESYGVGKSRHFVYGSLLLVESEASKLTVRIRELKRLRFGTQDVEVKSNWLRMPEERAKRYLTPFTVSEEELARFVDELYELIVLAPLELLAVVVDKVHMQEKYATPWYAPTAAYKFLLQRVVQAVPPGSTVSVTVDDISGATPRQNPYKTLVHRHHEQLRKTGSRLRKDLSFECLNGAVRFQNSQFSDLLQIADVVAYNVLRQFRDHGSDWEDATLGERVLPMVTSVRLGIAPDGRFRTASVAGCAVT